MEGKMAITDAYLIIQKQAIENVKTKTEEDKKDMQREQKVLQRET